MNLAQVILEIRGESPFHRTLTWMGGNLEDYTFTWDPSHEAHVRVYEDVASTVNAEIAEQNERGAEGPIQPLSKFQEEAEHIFSSPTPGIWGGVKVRLLSAEQVEAHRALVAKVAKDKADAEESYRKSLEEAAEAERQGAETRKALLETTPQQFQAEQQGGQTASRLAHNQEKAGSTPASATSPRSHKKKPAGNGLKTASGIAALEEKLAGQAA